MSGESRPSAKGFARSPRPGVKALRRRLEARTGLAPAFRLTRDEEWRLVAAARRGDRRALQRLLGALGPPVFRFARGFCGDSPDAEDVAQVVLAAVSSRLDDFRGEASLTTWAYTVARRACTRQRRHAIRAGGRVVSLEDPEAAATAGRVADPGPDPERAVESTEVREALQRALASLPPRHREVVLLRDVEGLPAREVGRVLKLSERAVKSRLHRARVELRRALLPFAPRPMPGCPDAARTVSRYLEGEIDADACAKLERHVAGCPDCQADCEALRRSLLACRSWRAERAPAKLGNRLQAKALEG